jgi:hypothetical protein
MKPVRLVLAVLTIAAASACGRNPTAPATPVTPPAHVASFDDNGGYMGSGLNTDTTKTPPPGN